MTVNYEREDEGLVSIIRYCTIWFGLGCVFVKLLGLSIPHGHYRNAWEDEGEAKCWSRIRPGLDGRTVLILYLIHINVPFWCWNIIYFS